MPNGWHLGAFGRRIRSGKGPAIEIKAFQRKLAAQYWRPMVKGTEFIERGVEFYQEQLQNQKKKLLSKIALELQMEYLINNSLRSGPRHSIRSAKHLAA
jgi:transposase